MNFVGIAVTQSRVVVSGIVESIYNPNSKVIYVTDKPLQEGGGQNPDGQSTPTTPDVINFPGTIAAVTVNDKGEIVVKGADGNETVYKRTKDAKTGKPKETVVADVAGNSYSVDKDGKVKKVINDSTIISNTPNQIDVSKLDDFEKLVKEVIDSLYLLKVNQRDSMSTQKDNNQKILNEKVGLMENLESNVEDQELIIETEISAPELIDKIDLLDSLVETNVVGIKRANRALSLLNEYLNTIKPRLCIREVESTVFGSHDIEQTIQP
ncbi:MAG: hypothetical protein K2U26_00815, partial [Cyclobacteriaceae bacterium]|nr:hypothetical protein [Cyclobacteriaceae bacterium]